MQKRLVAAFAASLAAASVLVPVTVSADDESDRWNSVSGSQSVNDVVDFLNAFPAGAHATAARAKYSALSGEMLPPEIVNIEVRFPQSADRSRVAIGPDRAVKLDILVKKDGTAGEIKIVARSGYDPYDSAAVGAARRATYLPAVENGMPVDAHLPYTVEFQIQCAPEVMGQLCEGKFPRK